MNVDILLESMTDIDCEYILSAQSRLCNTVSRQSVKRSALFRKLALTAALIVLLSFGFSVVLAAAPEVRELIFKIFQIETPEKPPSGNRDTDPAADGVETSEHGLRQIDVVNIDHDVKAFYYTSAGYVMPTEGGFYTCEWMDAGDVPENPAFWEITEDGIIQTETNRADFPLEHGGKTFRIIFDYAVLCGKLWIVVWPEGLDEDPYGNAWNATVLAGRTDVALLSVPSSKDGRDYTTAYFLLDLKTLEITNILSGVEKDHIWIYAGWFSEDLRYAILYGWDGDAYYGHWLCDLENQTISQMDELLQADIRHAYTPSPGFLDRENIVFCDWTEEDQFDLVRYNIPTKTKHVLEQDIPRGCYRSITDSRWNGLYGAVKRENGEYELINLRTNERLVMHGLAWEHVVISQSPDGTRIMVASKQADKFTRLGLLDPTTGVLKVLEREAVCESEYFWGWLNSNTVALTAHDLNGGYYVYVYEFID